MEISNICVIGNDNRMDYVAQKLYDFGYEVARNAEGINASSVIVLAPPVGEQITKTIVPLLQTGQRVYGGVVSNRLIHECKKLGIRCVDYLKIDNVTSQNATLTAMGIIRKATIEKAVIKESNCLVVGFGYCGKAISKELSASSARVDVMVRRQDLKHMIDSLGYGYVNFSEIACHNFEKYSYIFNTVPAQVLDEKLLSSFSPNVMIFDIASAPGGTDFSYCKQNGIYAVHYLGIPGKEYPKEAGDIIADTIIMDLNI